MRNTPPSGWTSLEHSPWLCVAHVNKAPVSSQVSQRSELSFGTLISYESSKSQQKQVTIIQLNWYLTRKRINTATPIPKSWHAV